MAAVYNNVTLSSFSDNYGQFNTKTDIPYKISVHNDPKGAQLVFTSASDSGALNICIDKEAETCRVGRQRIVVSRGDDSMMLLFKTEREAKAFQLKIQQLTSPTKSSIFDQRTEEASSSQYFQFYGYLSQQQNMMQDYIRTSTYQRAMLCNPIDFTDKVVLDVGAGSGILSFFAVQAGAKKVYAIEASSMAVHCENLVAHNRLTGKIVVLPGKVEEVDIPESIDIIISEPMGYMLYNERMLETFLHGKKWLKPGGKMFPTIGDLHIAPFSDEALYMEQYTKANFWYQQSFHGIDLSKLRDAAVAEYFKQPIVDTFDVRNCLAKPFKYSLNFQQASEEDLYMMDVPITYSVLQAGTVHGLAFWFDVAFIGSQQTIWLSTSPTEPLTHWYQVLCLLPAPVFVKQGQTLNGRVKLRANQRQSYDVDIELQYPGTNNVSTNTLDLKNPFFRYTGQAPQNPPGTNTESPTETYWNSLMTENSQQMTGYAVNGMLNGMGQVQQVQVQPAPINPGSIPSIGNLATTTRTSVGGGISPAAFHGQNVAHQSNPFGISNQYMIGDYAMSGSIVLPDQQAVFTKTDR